MTWPLALLLLQVTAPTTRAPACKPAPDRARRLAALQAPRSQRGFDVFGSWERLSLAKPLPKLDGHTSPEAFAKAYALSAPASRAFFAWLLWLDPGRLSPWEPNPSDVEGGLPCLEAAVRAAPGNLAPFASVLELSPTTEGARAALVVALLASGDELETGLRLLPVAITDWRPLLATHLASRHPEALLRILETFGPTEVGASSIPFLEAAWHELSSMSGQDALRRRTGEQLLRALLDEQLPLEAVRIYRSMIPKDRIDLLAARWSTRSAIIVIGGPAHSVKQADLRPALAAALLAAGDEPAAREVLGAMAAAPVAPGEPSRIRGGCGSSEERTLIDARLGKRPADAFDLFVLLRRCDFPEPFASLALPVLSSRYLAAERVDVDPAALDAPKTVGHRDRIVVIQGDPEVALPFDVRFSAPGAAALQAARAEERKRRVAAWALVFPSRATPPAAASNASAIISRQLTATPLPIFEERPSKECDTVLKGAVSPKATHLPDGFEPVSATQTSTGVVALALSQKLDPVGEISAGAYWLLLPKTRPLYLGLRQYRPYDVPGTSLPVVKRGRLYLRVNVRELDEHSITFPPVELATKRKQDGVCITAKLADLQRDSDGDGLTDLTEARMLTDPHSPDTDGDGLKDGQDALPQVSGKALRTPLAEVFEAFLIHLLWDAHRMPAIVEGIHKPGAPGHPAEHAFQDPAVTFLRASPDALQGVDLPMRVVPLTDALLEKARARFGDFYPLTVKVVPNDAGDKAYIEWDERWRGGSAQGTRHGDHWEFVSTGGWIT